MAAPPAPPKKEKKKIHGGTYSERQETILQPETRNKALPIVSLSQAIYAGAAKTSFLSLRNTPDANGSSGSPVRKLSPELPQGAQKSPAWGWGVSKPLVRVVFFFSFPSLAKVSFSFLFLSKYFKFPRLK